MQLTKAEEQVMQILWDMKEGLVKDIRDSFNDPKPARNTVSTVLRVLEKKGMLDIKPMQMFISIIRLCQKAIIRKVSYSD
jgi:predicted transcriptional regulator